jgi:ribosomal protein S18 acetylase RimI-like enzyme
LQEVSVLCCESNGKLNADLANKLKGKGRAKKASSGGFLHIDEIHVDPKYRKKDLGLKMLRALLTIVDFTFCVTFPTPWGIN